MAELNANEPTGMWMIGAFIGHVVGVALLLTLFALPDSAREWLCERHPAVFIPVAFVIWLTLCVVGSVITSGWEDRSNG